LGWLDGRIQISDRKKVKKLLAADEYEAYLQKGKSR